MSILFSPDGSLNVSVDPSDLPEQVDGLNIRSGAMVRCKNLRLNESGKAVTRDGSFTLNDTAILVASWIEIQAGVRYAFSGYRIYEDEVEIEQVDTSGDWSAMQYNSFNDTNNNIFALNGSDRKRIESSVVYEWGIEAPTEAPTIYAGTSGELTGSYNVKYTYVRKVGSVVVSESNPSPAGDAVDVTSGSVLVDVTQPTDTQVTHIRLYRSLNEGSYFYDQEITIASLGSAYGYTYSFEEEDEYLTGVGHLFVTIDETNDRSYVFSWEGNTFQYGSGSGLELTEIGSSDPVYSAPLGNFDSVSSDGSLGDELEEDHDRPPEGSFVIGPAYDGTCFILKDNLLYYCKAKRPEYWPALYYIELGSRQFPLLTAVFHNGQLYAMSRNEIFYVQGTGAGNFFPLPMKAKTGAQSAYGAVAVAGKGIYHTGPDGIYFFASGVDSKLTEDSLEPLFRGETKNGIAGVASMSTSWLRVFRNNLYFGYASEADGYPDNVMVVNLDTGRTVHYQYDESFSVLAEDTTNKRLVACGSDGFVRVIEDKDSDDDSGTEIEWDIQSKDYTLSTRRHFPRWVKWDVDATDATDATGEYLLSGEALTSHSLTGNRDTRRRLLDSNNGNRAALRIHGSGRISIYAAEAE